MIAPVPHRRAVGHRRSLLALAVLATLVAGVGSAATTATPDRVIDGYLAAYGAADAQALLALYAHDAVFEDVSQRHHVEGRDALAPQFAQLVGMHKAMAVEEKRRASRGSLVTVEVVYTGTLDCAALGRPDHEDIVYRLPAVLLFEIDAGKIRRQTDYLDFRTFTETFAALQAPAQP